MENEHRQDSDRPQTIDVRAILGGAHELCSGPPPPTISPTSPSVASATSVLSVLPCAFFFLRVSVTPW
jgi:hypothetical protein